MHPAPCFCSVLGKMKLIYTQNLAYPTPVQLQYGGPGTDAMFRELLVHLWKLTIKKDVLIV
jgi:hypothetical protein